MSPIDHAAEAAAIVNAHAARRTLDPISDRIAIDMADAYAIQAHVVAARFAAGERRIGWKLGYTSLAMREQMGVDQPNFGPLTDAMAITDDADVAGRFTQPRVEPEVALVFGRDVAPGADRHDVLDAVASARAALEVVDSVYTGYRFTIEDNTADGSSAAGVVLGGALPVAAIAEVAVVLTVDDTVDETVHGRGVGADASGHPADGVVWLVEQLARRGERVRAGDVVITGGLTSAAALLPGGRITARFAVDGASAVVVSVRHGRTTLG